MFARVRWLAVGAVVGLGGRAWARRAARKALRRSPPVRAVAGIAKVGSEVKAAVREGRWAMTAREAELLAERESRARSG
jgi:hypothetical protein